MEISNAAYNNDSRKSKSRYFSVDVTFPDGDTHTGFQVRVSDHWYITGDRASNGNAGTYTRDQLIRLGAIEFMPEMWALNSDGEIIFTSGKKPTVARVLSILKTKEYAEAWAAKYKEEVMMYA